MIKIEDSFHGKHITTYRPKGDKKYGYDDISQYLRKFQLCTALKLIGEISSNNIFDRYQIPHIRGVPIYDSILAFIAMELIKNSNDYRSRVMQVKDLLIAIDMYFGLPDPVMGNDNDNIEGCFIRFGASQFDYDRSIRVNAISRTLIIYGDLWAKSQPAKKLDINNAINSLSGLANIEEIVALFFLCLVSSSNHGFLKFSNFENSCNSQFKKYVSLDKQEKFIKWISCSYKDFRESYESHLPLLTPEYIKNRFNPLTKTPVLQTDKNLTQGNHEVFLVPVPRLLHLKTTRGIYFDLSKLFEQEKGDNLFRSNFGYVFHEYVGLLLQKFITDKEIKSEFKYKLNKNSKHSPDWLIIEDKRIIIIEVKQSCLYLSAKSWGGIDEIRENLKRTIGAAVEQFWKFEQAIKSKSVEKLNCFNNIEVIERLIVTYDCTCFSNSILREQIKQIYTQLPKDYHWHTISIDEFENFLPLVGNNIFGFLEKKRASIHFDSMDFNEYCGEEFINCNGSNSYLKDIYDSFFLKLGMSRNNSDIESH
jgi:hypothetical protein